jgi:uncharacterized membrane protein
LPYRVDPGSPTSGGLRVGRARHLNDHHKCLVIQGPATDARGKHQEGGRREKATTPALNPVLLQHAEERRRSLENRVADQITRFAGSMKFVYLHVIWFTTWIGLQVEHYPFGLLTMIVSLEAIFLSTFVMISQNRADEKRQVLADQQWTTVRQEEQQNEELIHISNQILDLTKAIHAMTIAWSAGDPNRT